MRDPLEGLTATGSIRTGASRKRIPDRYVDLLDGAATRIREDTPEASVPTMELRSPDLADGLNELLDWSSQRSNPTPARLAHHLATTIERIADQFATDVGLWPT